MASPQRVALVFFCGTVLFASQVQGDGPLAPGDHARTLWHDGRNRSCIIHVPPRYDGQHPTPVVLAFHAAETNASRLLCSCGLNEKADKEGFIAVYPNGTGRRQQRLTWNGGNCCGSASRNHVDDVGFTRALLDDLARVANVDAKRVFATGISNGAMLCYRLAVGTFRPHRCHRARLGSDGNGNVPSAAPRAGDALSRHRRRRSALRRRHWAPVPGHGRIPSVEHSIHLWVKADGCPEEPVVVDMPNKADDGTTVQRRKYGPGKDGAEVVLFVIHGGGHTWPGREPRVKFLGKSTRNISANDLMWEFFQRHPMPAPRTIGSPGA